MDLNLTAGIFLILIIAIVIAVVLCCCKAYILCRRGDADFLYQPSSPIFNGLEVTSELPVANKFVDDPPTYHDVISGKVKTTLSSCESQHNYGILSANNDEAKQLEGAIIATCSNSDLIDNSEPPLYSCVVIDDVSDGIEVQPPPYSEHTLPRIISERSKKETGNTALKDASRPNNALRFFFDRFQKFANYIQKTDKTENLSFGNDFVSSDRRRHDVITTSLEISIQH